MTPEQIAKSGSESSHQIALFAQCAYHVGKYPELRWFHAIPNGGLRSKVTAGKLKAEGVKSGVSDTLLPVKRSCYSGLYIEMKKPSLRPVKATSKGGVSDDQQEFGEFVTKQGFYFAVCYDWQEAWNCLMWYLAL